jgi:uncharacterized membrane protein
VKSKKSSWTKVAAFAIVYIALAFWTVICALSMHMAKANATATSFCVCAMLLLVLEFLEGHYDRTKAR